MAQVQVAVAVIIDKNDHVLIAKRGRDQHQGDKWEFPGGKVEAGETSLQALHREIKEELGIDIQQAELMTHIVHGYTEKTVTLDVYQVSQWLGTPKGAEGQPIRWVAKAGLSDYTFPTANAEILQLLG